MGLHWARRLLPDLLPADLAREIWKIDADPYSEGGKPSIFNGEGAECPPKIEGYPFELSERQDKAFPIVDLTTGKEMTWVEAETSRRTSRRKLREFLRRGVRIQVNLKAGTGSDFPSLAGRFDKFGLVETKVFGSPVLRWL